MFSADACPAQLESNSTTGTSAIGYIQNSRSEFTDFPKNIRCPKNSFRGKDRNLPIKQLPKDGLLSSDGGPICMTEKLLAFGFNLRMAKQNWSDDRIAGARRHYRQPVQTWRRAERVSRLYGGNTPRALLHLL